MWRCVELYIELKFETKINLKKWKWVHQKRAPVRAVADRTIRWWCPSNLYRIIRLIPTNLCRIIRLIPTDLTGWDGLRLRHLVFLTTVPSSRGRIRGRWAWRTRRSERRPDCSRRKRQSLTAARSLKIMGKDQYSW